MAKIEGVTDIQTNIAKTTCSFKLTSPDIDYQTKLEEFAKTNPHLAGFQIQ
ncbi:MAG: hypothetical protein J5I93_02905 [Pirellulaceae bacterium]|nr:hypothetical protein [Pirellulaceae bacterium]